MHCIFYALKLMHCIFYALKLMHCIFYRKWGTIRYWEGRGECEGGGEPTLCYAYTWGTQCVHKGYTVRTQGVHMGYTVRTHGVHSAYTGGTQCVHRGYTRGTQVVHRGYTWGFKIAFVKAVKQKKNRKRKMDPPTGPHFRIRALARL